MGASDRYLSCPAVSHISNLTVASSSATVCVRNAAGYYVHDRFSPVFSVELGRRGEICFDQLTQKAVRNLSQVPSTRRVIPPRVCPRVCGLTSNRGLLKLEEFVPDKPNDQATFAHGRVAEQHELEVAHPATAHFSVRTTHSLPLLVGLGLLLFCMPVRLSVELLAATHFSFSGYGSNPPPGTFRRGVSTYFFLLDNLTFSGRPLIVGIGKNKAPSHSLHQNTKHTT